MLITGTLQVLMAVISTVVSQQSPNIIFITANQQKHLGDNVEMTCTTIFAQNFPVVWLRLPDTPISNNAGRIIPDTRFSLRHDPGSTTYTVTIKDVQERDTGTYQCQIMTSTNNKVTRDTELQVGSQPIISEDTSRDAYYAAGSDATLFCNARGNPDPTFTWYRENKAILPTGGQYFRGKTLRIFHIKKEDRGVYICVAENKIGKNIRNIRVLIEFKPEVTSRLKGVKANRGGVADLECFIEGSSPINIDWVHNSNQLFNDPHYTIVIDSSGDSKISRLHISNIEERHFGTYQCKAHNKLGSSLVEILVYDHGINKSPSSFSTSFILLITAYLALLINNFAHY